MIISYFLDLKYESFLVFDLSKVNWMKCSLNQGERKLKNHIFFFFAIIQLRKEIVKF